MRPAIEARALRMISEWQDVNSDRAQASRAMVEAVAEAIEANADVSADTIGQLLQPIVERQRRDAVERAAYLRKVSLRSNLARKAG